MIDVGEVNASLRDLAHPDITDSVVATTHLGQQTISALSRYGDIDAYCKESKTSSPGHTSRCTI